MALSTTLGLVHAAAAVLALATIAYLLRAGRRAAVEVPGRAWLLLALGSVAVWAGHLSWWYLLGASEAQLLWLPSVGATMGALLAWSVAVLRPGQVVPRTWVVFWLADPVLLVAAQLGLGASTVAVRHDDRIDYGWFYGVHVLLVFAMMLATASLWVSSRADPSPTLRLLSRVVVAGLLAAGVAQGLQLMVLDVILSVTGVVVVVLVVSAAPDSLRPRPRSGVLLDGLGALVLVFDRDDGLVHLNAPARAFLARRDGVVPAAGTPAGELLPVTVDEALAGVEVRLDGIDASGGAVDFVCFAARLGPSTSPPHGSVVVLRSAAESGPPSSWTDAGHVVDFARRLEQLTSGGGPGEALVVLGLSFECAEDADRAAQAIEFVVGSLDSLIVDVVGEHSLVAVAPAHVEPYLLDVAMAWQPRAIEDGPPEERTVLSVSLSPVLAGELIVRHGSAGQAPVLVAEVRRELLGGA